MSRVKTEAQERARFRASQERRAENAFKTLDVLMSLRGLDEHDIAELYAIKCRLIHAIKNQHVNDAEYKQYKQRHTRYAPMEGDF